MPVPPLGFHPSGSISTRRAVRPLGRLCPREVGWSSWRHLDRLGNLGSLGTQVLRRPSCRGDGASENLPLFRALLPASGRISGPIVQANPATATLVGFSSLGNSLSPSATPRGSILSRASSSGAQARPEVAPQSVRPAKRLAGLSRVCRPFRGLPPSRPSQLFAGLATLGYPSKTVRCCQWSCVFSSSRFSRGRSSLGTSSR